MIKRRTFITLLSSAAALAARGAGAAAGDPGDRFSQQWSPEPSAHEVAAFRKRLNEAGCVEGQNLAIEFCSAEGENYALLLKGARDHAPSHDVEHGDCENGQLRITRNTPDRHCDHGRYDCDDDFGLDFGHGDGPPERVGGPAEDTAGPRASISPVQRKLSRPTMAKGSRSLNSFWIFWPPRSASRTSIPRARTTLAKITVVKRNAYTIRRLTPSCRHLRV
jgi:hypothetical protein